MRGEWLGPLRQVAGRVREELLSLAEATRPPRDAKEAKAREQVADEVACRALLEGLEEVGFMGTLICEDLGVRELGGESGPPYLLVDPLDGTRNFSRGLAIASISMAVCTGPSLEHLKEALVLEVFSGQEFWAVSGRGAFSSSGPIEVSKTAELSEAVVSVDKSRVRRGTGGWVLDIAYSVSATRQLGAASLELCQVARGVFDAHVDLREYIRPTDVAAGVLIAREAGACVWLKGRREPKVALALDEKVCLIAANPSLFEQLACLLRPYMAGGGLLLRPSGYKPK